MSAQPGMIADRPLPAVTELTAPFWAAARQHRLVAQRCADCQTLRFPPERACFECGSTSSNWESLSGRATLYSWTVGYPPLLPYFARLAPVPVVAVELEEGPRMVSRLPDVSVGEYQIGMPLQADFEDIDDTLSLVVFRKA
jgi:uncharacterized protein